MEEMERMEGMEEIKEMEETNESVEEVSEAVVVEEEEEKERKRSEEVAVAEEKVSVIEFDLARDALLDFINLASAGGLIEEVCFSVSEKGLLAVNTDPANAMLSAVALAGDYMLSAPKRRRDEVWIEANRVSNLLMHVEKNEDIHVKVMKEKIEMRSATKKIVAPLLTEGRRKDFSKIVEISDDLAVKPKFEYKYEYEVQVSELLNALMIKDANIVFQCYESGVSITQYDVDKEYETTTLFRYAEEGEVKCRVVLSYEYLRKILSVCNRSNYFVCRFAEEEIPPAFQYVSPNGVDAVFIIAPRIEME